MIELSKIAAIAGQGGLFQIKTPLKNGVMMESLDEKKTRFVAGPTSKVSILSEISIYTKTAEGSVSLESVLKNLHKKFGKQLPANPKSDGADLKKLLESVLPEVDLERVYVSDIKKLVSWYIILLANAPDVLQEFVTEEIKTEVEEKEQKKPTTGKSKLEAGPKPENETPSEKKLAKPASKKKEAK
jgi:hypothetical protein